MDKENNYSDYGSGSSTDSHSRWSSYETWQEFEIFSQQIEGTKRRRSTSFVEPLSGRISVEDIMQDFKQNGLDSPYDPEQENNNFGDFVIREEMKNQVETSFPALSGMGPLAQYIRQKSWPAPEVIPSTSLPRPLAKSTEIPTPRYEETTPQPSYPSESNTITLHQLQVLCSLPESVIALIVREYEAHHALQKNRRQDEMICRFCKNNGEREAYYRSHRLRVRGRVACPVLRAYRCRRCGAKGDHAHTLKYCPLATADERNKSAAMMRSVRLAAGRHRAAPSSVHDDYVLFGETSPTVITDGTVYGNADLDPLWEALEKKLML